MSEQQRLKEKKCHNITKCLRTSQFKVFLLQHWKLNQTELNCSSNLIQLNTICILYYKPNNLVQTMTKQWIQCEANNWIRYVSAWKKKSKNTHGCDRFETVFWNYAQQRTITLKIGAVFSLYFWCSVTRFERERKRLSDSAWLTCGTNWVSVLDRS